ncbi:MAG TPA: oligosaccharide flippase family protein, partial [Paludibacter sp.]|nr:oligosaccharide flippase family protein [Paludibacter sp.]
MSDNLKQKMLGVLAWSTVDRFGQQAVQFVISMILARLLTPADYTLIGLVMVFVSLSNTLVDSGFGQALVRKSDATEIDFN